MRCRCQGMILRGDGIFFGALSLVRGLVGAVDDVKAYHDQQNVRRGRRAQQGRQNVRRMWPSVVGGWVRL